MNHKYNEAERILREDVLLLQKREHYGPYLRLLARIHSYRIRNTVLIYFQKPDAVMTAGYHAWKNRFQRCVRKGEKALTILSCGKESADLTSCRTVSVFDLSQTAGTPVPEELLPVSPEDSDPLLLLKAAVLSCPFPVRIDHTPAGSDGFFRTIDRDIVINEELGYPEAFYVLMREYARAQLYEKEPDQSAESGRRRNAEAEAAAYAVCSYFGISVPEPECFYDGEKNPAILLEGFERIRVVISALTASVNRLRFPSSGSSGRPLIFS